jgi:hypothetical protein
MRRLLLVGAVLWIAIPVLAQQGGSPPPTSGGLTYQEFEQTVTAGATHAVPVPPAPADAQTGHARAGLSYVASDAQRERLGEALYSDHLAALDYNRRVFEWQMVSTQISFFVVIGLVVSGLVFAAIQFRRGMMATQGNPDFSTDLELTAKGLKVSSPVLGVVVLALSLGFFYLYLRHVYPIEYARNAMTLPVAAEEAE